MFQLAQRKNFSHIQLVWILYGYYMDTIVSKHNRVLSSKITAMYNIIRSEFPENTGK